MRLLACAAALGLAACAHESWDVVDPAPGAASRALPPGLGLRGPPPVDARVGGAIDPEAIRKVLRDHEPQIRWCFEQRLAVNPALADDAVGACVLERLATWEFPKPSAGGLAIVTYPWILRPSKAPDAAPAASVERPG